MTDEKKIIKGLDKELMQLINAEMNDPVIGKLLNRNAAYVLGKEIKLLLIDKAYRWLDKRLDNYNISWIEDEYCWSKEMFLKQFKQAMKGE